MPSNKNAILRYHIIDSCLSNRYRKWTWQDILDKVNEALLEDDPRSKGIGKTTFFDDLNDIEYRIYKAEIKRTQSGKKTYYSYADENYSIRNLPLSDAEARQVRAAIQVLSRFAGMPQFEWVNEMVLLLETKMGLKKTEEPVISFQDNPNYSGLSYIPELFSAITNKVVLKIIYQDFRSPVPYEVEIHPYHLRQYNSRWFLFGYNPARPDVIQNLSLDRIKKIDELSGTFKNCEIHWSDYFSDMVGVSRRKGEPQDIKLLITDPEQASYIATKPIHESQKKNMVRVKDGFETTIRVIPNYELEMLILSFGERVKVLSPESLRETIAERAKKLRALYKTK